MRSWHMPITRNLCMFVLSLFLFSATQAQVQPYIQLSGIITDNQSGMATPYASVTVPSEMRGVSASEIGFFTIVVKPSDTLQFSALGYKPKTYVVPDSVTNDLVSIAVSLSRDTLELDPFVVYPWPSPEDFREAFLAYQEVQPYQMQPIPGIRGKEFIDTVPKPPSPIKNPISFLYEEVVKPIQWRKPKRDMVDDLPEWK